MNLKLNIRLELLASVLSLQWESAPKSEASREE